MTTPTTGTGVTATVERMIRNYPALFVNRTQALRHLLCVPGNGYEWQDGQLVSVFVERERTDEEVQDSAEWLDKFPDNESIRETRQRYADDNARWMDIRARAAELAVTPGPIVVPREGPYDPMIEPRPLPDDATEEWRAVAEEYRATVREYHPELFGERIPTRMDNPPACGAPKNWRWGYLRCGCCNDGFGGHVK